MCKRCTTAGQTNTLQLYVSEGAGEMLDEDHGVMFFKLFEQPPPLLDRYGFAGGNVMK